MDQLVEISHWRGPDGKSPVTDFYFNLPATDQARIAKCDDKYQRYTLQQFVRTPYFEKVRGERMFWELKYLAKGGFNYRVICVIYKDKVVGLIMFRGSGSGGKLSKHMRQARERASNLSYLD